MIAGAKYVHTNLVARDWRRLAQFYVDLFGCSLVPPERDYAASEVEAGTGVPGASLAGAHLRLPGHGPEGPTLEVFSYSKTLDASRAVNRVGFGHLAFQVASVPEARQQVLAAGGGPVGDVVRVVTATGAGVTWCYVTDPEGNILELQSWDAWPHAGAAR